MSSAEPSFAEAAIWNMLRDVMDPEVPVLSVVDLGVIRRVDINDAVEITVTPTYSGCPATEMINQMILDRLAKEGIRARIKTQLAPPWTTDWMSEAGREKLHAYGIAPPVARNEAPGAPAPACPRCDSTDTERISQFGSTACKALYRCKACAEPFEYFKCH